MIQKLRKEIKKSMVLKKETGESVRYQTLKNILEKAQKIAKEKREDIVTDSMIVDAAKKEIKQLNDLLQFCNPGTERYEETKKAILVAEEFLPKMASEEDILSFLEENVADIRNVGDAMKSLKAKFGDGLDGRMASSIVKNFLKK